MVSPRSRRRFLALCATGSVTSLAGCPATDSPNGTRSTATPEVIQSASGLVWRKHVNVELTRTESPVWTDILKLQFDREDSEVFGEFDPAYLDGAIDDASVTISSETHDALTTEFGGVNYEVALGPINDAGEHLHAQARRDAFNDLPLAGDASVENFWVQVDDDLRIGYVRPTESDPPTQSPTTTGIDRFDLGASFEGY